MRQVAFFLALVAPLAGCATIMSGKTQPLTFNSSPEGADVYVNGMKVGTTPITVEVRRKEGTVITLKKDGFQETTLQPREKSNPWLIGNLIWSYFSTTATTVDYVNDTNIEYTPDHFYSTLKPVEVSQLGSFYWNVTRSAFILHRYSHLTTELAKGSGENLSSLLALLRVDQADRNETVRELRTLAQTHSSAPGFTKAVLSRFSGNDSVLFRRRL